MIPTTAQQSREARFHQAVGERRERTQSGGETKPLPGQEWRRVATIRRKQRYRPDERGTAVGPDPASHGLCRINRKPDGPRPPWGCRESQRRESRLGQRSVPKRAVA